MAPGHIVEEISGDRKLVREYDASGKLLRIRVLPLSRGATSDLPPVAPMPRAPPAEPPASSAGRAMFWRRKRAEPTPPQAEPAPVAAPVEPPAPVAPPTAVAPTPAPAPEPTPIRVRFADEPAPERGIDVVVEPVVEPLAFVPPVEAPAPEPQPVEEAPIVFVEPEPAPEPASEPEPAPVVLAAEPEPAREPEPMPEPERVRRFTHFEVLAVESARPHLAEPERLPEPAVAPAPEPVAEPEVVAEPQPISEPEPPAPEPVVTLEPEPEPTPPASYAALVPDVDAKVDAILARQDAPDKRRKRAPIPAPAFEPLRREPWEDRLDAALQGS